MPRTLITLSAALLLATAHAAPPQITPIPDARAQIPATQLVPQPKRAEFPAGTLALTGLGIRTVGNAPELNWAMRDLRTEWKTRLGATLADAPAGKPAITIGTLADADLAARAKAAGLGTTAAEGYALWVDAGGAYIVGADAKGAYEGAQTLRQLLTPAGLRFARISDSPAMKERVAMIYLDQYSKGVNDALIPMLAALKYNTVLVMSNYVQWDTAKAGGYANPGGASKAEAKRVATLAREHGLEVIPLIETLGHVEWMYYGGKNKDLYQDPDSQNPFAYDTLNPATYSRVLFPIFKEAVEVFGARTIHIGHDEVRNRDRFPARANGKAAGFEKLFVDDTVKIHDYLKSLGANTMIWHDSAFSDSVIATLPAKLPRDIQVAYWNYAPDRDYPIIGQIAKLGFGVLGASWDEEGNADGLANAVVKAKALGMIQTRWTGYFGNPSIWDGQAQQGVAYVRAAGAFWNPEAKAVANAESLYRDLYAPAAYRAAAGATVNLSAAVTRSLTDNDEKGWIGKGPDIDLRNLKTGVQQIGAYKFNISGAVMLRGKRGAVSDLPTRATVEIGRRADAIAFLHTAGWPGAVARENIGHYEIAYADGTKLVQPLEYGRHIRAWTDLLPTSMIPAPGWAGKTADGLEVNVPVLEWKNPKPGMVIKSVTLVSEGLNANPTLIGLTLIGEGK
ncbi:glycoside hydrolase family 20 zincin-like fold domain-containing protein [Deinococcus arenicola]|uniref:beta-N-acetylhexosaminidase n=1 Tax=Deinococcus arenicola TaxID=2994950 RepID=A0ABU4DS54_9DEIO|nr:glycoside hydrolase family 20 zincin-like fold domain-containing protein [Deinococcus sp. ZS9-10]MDV6374924.1 family 20 glycosylhydrolase [Deinococcus sp. ZS9-10]